MWTKSEIFKRAHEMARQEREQYPRTIGADSYRETFRACLIGAYRESREALEPAKSPELASLEAEHNRRDLACAFYFGSSEYKRNESLIQEMKLAA